jgi:uncharacterized protein involved in exopolysaccharide biosynthesis
MVGERSRSYGLVISNIPITQLQANSNSGSINQRCRAVAASNPTQQNRLRQRGKT